MSGISKFEEVIDLVSDDEAIEMAAASAPAEQGPTEVIDLVSDDEAIEAAAAPTKRNSTGNTVPAPIGTIDNKGQPVRTTKNIRPRPDDETSARKKPSGTKYGLYTDEHGLFQFQVSQYDLNIIENWKAGWLNDSGIEFCLARLTGDRKTADWFLYGPNFYTTYLKQNHPNKLNMYKKYKEHRPPFDKEKFIMPVNLEGQHWTVVMVNVNDKAITMYDSLGKYHKPQIKEVIEQIKAYVEEKLKKETSDSDEKRDSHEDWERNKWKIEHEIEPEQKDGFNCGIYVYLRVRKLISGTGMLGEDEAALKSYLQGVRLELGEFIRSCSRT
jgi:hypothetical protein